MVKKIKRLFWRVGYMKRTLTPTYAIKGRCLSCAGSHGCPTYGCPCKANENLVKIYWF